MARSSNLDPIEKYRFQVLVFENASGAYTSGTSSTGDKEDSRILKRSGFTEVTTPRSKTKEIEYRENTHGNTVVKQPGLTKYENISLRRGVTKDNGLYSWYTKVNTEAGSLNKFQETLAGLASIPFQDPNFRREVLISSMDRTGKFTKHWFLYNAWPVEYKGLNDFDSKASEIGIEELVLTFENCIEVEGDTVEKALHNVTVAAEQAASKAGIAGAVSGALGFLKGLKGYF